MGRGNHLGIDDQHAGRLRQREVLALEEDSSIVHQDVGTAELATQAGSQGGDSAGVGDIGNVRENVVATVAQLPGGFFDRLGIAADHQYQAAGSGEITRHRGADTPRRTGHYGKFLR